MGCLRGALTHSTIGRAPVGGRVQKMRALVIRIGDGLQEPQVDERIGSPLNGLPMMLG